MKNGAKSTVLTREGGGGGGYSRGYNSCECETSHSYCP